MDDFCILIIGEDDFTATKNYVELVANIRETLQKVQNTNVVICVPTYKYGHDREYLLYNQRVENFNNLLYLDALTHEYAYIFDSNKKLKYDYSMFKNSSGSINNNGLRVMFKALKNYMIGITKFYKNINVNETNAPNGKINGNKTESTFFRE